MNVADQKAGYRIRRVFVAEQSYKVVVEDGLVDKADPSDRNVNFGWDWRPVGPRMFEVTIQVLVEPIKRAPERMAVQLIGVFTADEGPLSIPFSAFVKENAPAILFPFAREVISTMSSRGLYGTFHLNPINIISLVENFDPERASGVGFLKAHPDIAETFGLSFVIGAPNDRQAVIESSVAKV